MQACWAHLLRIALSHGWAVQAYKYIQRPAAPMQAAEQGSVPYMPGTRVISGQPIGMGGRARLSTFPPFPQVCAPTAALSQGRWISYTPTRDGV